MWNEKCSNRTSIAIILVVPLKEATQVNPLEMYFNGKAALWMRMRTWWKLLKGTVSGVYSEELEKRDYEFFIFIFPSYGHCSWWYMERWMHERLWVFLRLSKIDGTSGPLLSSFYHLKFSLSWFMGVLLILSTQDWICYLAHRWNSEIEAFLWGNWSRGLKTREGKECSCVFRRGEFLKWK